MFVIPIDIASSAVGLKIWAKAAMMKKYKPAIKKKRKKHVVLLGKRKLNSIEVLISKAVTDRCISDDKSDSMNNVLKVYNNMKEAIKSLKGNVFILYYSLDLHAVFLGHLPKTKNIKK